MSNPNPAKEKLTRKQTWLIAGLMVLQIPSSLIFYPLAAVLCLTVILIPVSMVLVGIGSMPLSLALKYKAVWQFGRASAIASSDTVAVSAGS